MPAYNEMYLKLFNKVSDVIRDLQEIQQLCEDLYIFDEDKPPIQLPPRKTGEDEIP